MVHVSWMVYRLLGQWSCSSGVYHEPYAKGIPIGEDGELSEPEAPAGARFPLPALPARAELRDAEVHAMLGELDFGESAVMGDATAEERQAIANFDIRAFA